MCDDTVLVKDDIYVYARHRDIPRWKIRGCRIRDYKYDSRWEYYIVPCPDEKYDSGKWILQNEITFTEVATHVGSEAKLFI